MKLHITPRAAADLEGIHTYIASDNAAAARQVIARIVASVEMIEMFPNLGREGYVTGTLEHVVPGLPYVIVYRIERAAREQITVVSIYHGRQERR